MACMASLPPLSGYILTYFDNVRVKLSTHAYFEVLFHSPRSKYINYNNRIYDVISNELYNSEKKIGQTSTM